VGLHSIALQQIGEQEAYIEELEEKIKSLEKELSKKESKVALTRQENRKIAQEVRREQVIEKIYTESREFKGENKRLREEIKTLIGKLCLKNTEIETLKAQLTSIS
jgi:predicted RNase H-like nuclease (RuvC/YqgF family)